MEPTSKHILNDIRNDAKNHTTNLAINEPNQ